MQVIILSYYLGCRSNVPNVVKYQLMWTNFKYVPGRNFCLRHRFHWIVLCKFSNILRISESSHICTHMNINRAWNSHSIKNTMELYPGAIYLLMIFLSLASSSLSPYLWLHYGEQYWISADSAAVDFALNRRYKAKTSARSDMFTRLKQI